MATRFGTDRFEIALWNCCRRSDFFPLPQHIEAECSYLRAQSRSVGGSMFTVYECVDCGKTQASVAPQPCIACGSEARKILAKPEGHFNTAAYERRIKMFPQEFVGLADVIREVSDKRRAEGKQVWDIRDSRRGDAG